MAGDEPIVYLNGEYMPASSAVVSAEDRGFLFGDSCYEVTVVLDGVCLVLDRHLARLQRGLDELRIPFSADTLAHVHHELISRNSLASHPVSAVYVQVTRGVAPRSHAFPVGAVPTVLARAQPIAGPSVAMLELGTQAITAPDIRWGRVDIKTTGLLANVLAQQAAVDAGADDVILHRDGLVTEGSHTNVYGVIDGVLITAPADHRILAGVTRGIVLGLAGHAGITVEQREWTLAELASAGEVLMSSTTAGVRPIVGIDGVPVAEGTRGPVTVALQTEYRRFIAEQRRSDPTNS